MISPCSPWSAEPVWLFSQPDVYNARSGRRQVLQRLIQHFFCSQTQILPLIIDLVEGNKGLNDKTTQLSAVAEMTWQVPRCRVGRIPAGVIKVSTCLELNRRNLVKDINDSGKRGDDGL